MSIEGQFLSKGAIMKSRGDIRRETFLHQINPASMAGLEVGALNRPTVLKSAGNILYADFADTAELRRLYESQPTVPVNDIVDVDLVWSGDSKLPSLLGDKKLDYVLASHVFEHIPNPIDWIYQIYYSLKEGGILSLIVPDKRFTFDRLRNLSSISDMIHAWVEGVEKPTSAQVFDHIAYHCRFDIGDAWNNPEGDIAISRVHNERQALELAGNVFRGKQYYDSHCWVWTPRHMLKLLRGLTESRIMPFELAGFSDSHPGEIDFFLSLRALRKDNIDDATVARQLEAIDLALSRVTVGSS